MHQTTGNNEGKENKMYTDHWLIMLFLILLTCSIAYDMISRVNGKNQTVFGRHLDMLNLLLILSEDHEWHKQEDIFKKFHERGYKKHGILIFALMSLEQNHILERDDRTLIDGRRVVGRDPTCPRFRRGCDEFVERALKEPQKYLIL